MCRLELPLKYHRVAGDPECCVRQTPVCYNARGSICLQGELVCRFTNSVLQMCLLCILVSGMCSSDARELQNLENCRICKILFCRSEGGGETSPAQKFADFLTCVCLLNCLPLFPSKLSVKTSFLFVLSQQLTLIFSVTLPAMVQFCLAVF